MARKPALQGDEAPELIVDIPEGATCAHCEAMLHSGGRSRRSLWRLDGPVIVVQVIRRCSRRECPGWHEYRYPQAEVDRLALRTGDFGLDVVLRVGALRYEERRSVPEIHKALQSQYPTLRISERAVSRLLHDYNALSQALLVPVETLKEALQGRTSVTISLDGLQPDQGKDMLWLVRDLATGLPLASLTHPSVSHVELAALLRQVIARGLTITGVVSDGQECIVKAVREVLPGVPHQICQVHFLKNLADPLLKKDAALRTRIKKGLVGCGPLSAKSSARSPPLLPPLPHEPRLSIRYLSQSPQLALRSHQLTKTNGAPQRGPSRRSRRHRPS